MSARQDGSSPKQAKDFLRAMGGPIVLKPLPGAGRSGAFKRTDPKEMELYFPRALGRARKSTPGTFALGAEPALKGNEYGCDFILKNGRVTILRVIQKYFLPAERLRTLVGPVNTGVRISAQSGGSWRKSGIPLSSLERFWGLARQKKQVRTCGLHFPARWNMGPEAQVDFIREPENYFPSQGQKLVSEIEFIDIDGGFWPERGTGRTVSHLTHCRHGKNNSPPA